MQAEQPIKYPVPDDTEAIDIIETYRKESFILPEADKVSTGRLIMLTGVY